MRAMVFGAIAVVGLLSVAPEVAAAQDGWWDWALREVVQARDGRNDGRLDERVDGRIIRTDRVREQRASRGPKFCQNGRGHPVHGRAWCVEKGFGRDARGSVVWEERGWEDVVLGTPRYPTSRYPDRTRVDRGGLLDVLGDVVLGRLMAESRLSDTDRLSGRWLSPGGRARVLQVRAGSIPLAELSDLDGDGRVDAVLIPRR